MFHGGSSQDFQNKGREGMETWRVGKLDKDHLKILNDYNFSDESLAAIHYKVFLNNITTKGRNLPKEDYMEIRYEDIVKDPKGKAKECLDFSNLVFL